MHRLAPQVKIVATFGFVVTSSVEMAGVLLVFSFLIALDQLQIDTQVLKIAEIGIVVAIALAVGLAFGLGGRGRAEELLEKWRKHTQE